MERIAIAERNIEVLYKRSVKLYSRGKTSALTCNKPVCNVLHGVVTLQWVCGVIQSMNTVARILCDIREISLHVQRRIRVDVGLVFNVKINSYLKIKYTFEIFHQPAVKL